MRDPRALPKVSFVSLLVALAGACGGGAGGGTSTRTAGSNGGAPGDTGGAAGDSSGGTAGASSNGTAGATGTAGASNGAAGATAGQAGSMGTAGSSVGGAGAAGASATAGASGTSAAGASGTAGANGTAGASGTAGAMGAAGATGAAGASTSTFPARFAAPYVETWGNATLTDLATATGNRFYTLAFIIAGDTCQAAWNGDTPIGSDTHWATQIANLRKAGGDVIISFGGADGTELGDSCTSVESLQAAYQAVITKYDLRWMDLDIESGAESKTADIDRRNKALKNLQTLNPNLKISYTLGVDPSGLPQDQRSLLANAKTNGTRVDIVNIMAMDYGSCNLDMGMAAIAAATATHGQIQTLGTTSSVGVTPMIGVNDTSCEDFTTANATALVTFAQANDYVSLLAFWAVGADQNHDYLNIFTTIH
jgi:hypothetical protein